MEHTGAEILKSSIVHFSSRWLREPVTCLTYKYDWLGFDCMKESRRIVYFHDLYIPESSLGSIYSAINSYIASVLRPMKSFDSADVNYLRLKTVLIDFNGMST